MSLLNDVLKDIDLRRRDPREQQILTSILVSDEHDKIEWSTPALIAALVLVCASLTWWAVNRISSQDQLLSTFELPITSNALNSSMFQNPSLQVAQIEAPGQMNFVVSTPQVSEIVASNAQPRTPSQAIETAQVNDITRPQVQVAPRETAVAPIITRQSYVDPSQLNLTSVTAAVTALNNGQLSVRDFNKSIQIFMNTIQPMELELALNAVEYSAKNRDGLLTLLDLNRQLAGDLNMNRNDHLHRIYEQLRMKSIDAGYWTFLQAILFDKESNLRQAGYYYQQALQTDDLTVKQRQLSALRIEQLRYELRDASQ
ncbi:MAG: hypothetical protein VX185_10225 [Pseudomonadota bacterium]|nr:hypothetical protein [Pseudomonadota bacterium]